MIGHVANTQQRHVQRARDRCRRHRQHVDVLLQLLQPLLVADAEALLFIDDEQSEIAILHIFREQPVRSDDDVDFARRDLFERLLDFLRRSEAAEHLDTYRKRRESALEGFEVLQSEHGRRSEHRHLFPVTQRLERGAHGDFGLAEADVAAQQPVHRLLAFHVALDLTDGLN